MLVGVLGEVDFAGRWGFAEEGRTLLREGCFVGGEVDLQGKGIFVKGERIFACR